MKHLKFIGIAILSFTFSCCESETEFKKVEFDIPTEVLEENRSVDVIEMIGWNLNPIKKYDYWALLRADDGGNEHVDILNEKGDLSKRQMIDLTYNREGFMIRGHHSTMSYYILAVKNEEVFEIKDAQSLVLFLDDIDTMEEALLITQINEFKIDRCSLLGGSYRKNKNGFEFNLMKSNHQNMSIIDRNSYSRTQFLVTVTEQGNINSKSCGVYCIGTELCYCDR